MFVNPDKIVARLGLYEGMRVADFGAGTGFYSKAAGARVGHTGKVYAIEAQKDLVKNLEKDLIQRKISNIDCIWGDIERAGGTKIADRSMDAVIISNVLSQAEDKLGLIDEAKRVLKKGGKILLIDWEDNPKSDLGQALSRTLGKDRIITSEKAKEFFVKRGFKFLENIEASINHYGIIFKYE
ncbi:MAG TPA: methyltransferase domain-containing protein [Candidatus Paceibacterota bacterium]|nr:methyltransferase domain-containing protein [Candidatus Paceibacterota bacterium]